MFRTTNQGRPYLLVSANTMPGVKDGGGGLKWTLNKSIEATFDDIIQKVDILLTKELMHIS